MKYTVVAWLVDKRCTDNCKMVSYEADTIEEAEKWTSKIKKAYGDSVKLYNNEDNTVSYIDLREEQRV